MKNFITIEGKEFELPDELVNKIKEELNKPKKLTYPNICAALYGYKKEEFYVPRMYCTSEKHSRKIEAINKIMNTAKYLNGDWKSDWDNGRFDKHRFYIKPNNEIDFDINKEINNSVVYFKTRELAQQCIDILGEETIKLALSTDW